LCSENGRSKRRNASADTWSPEEDEVRIYFERIDDGEPRRAHSRARAAGRAMATTTRTTTARKAVIPADLDARVKELCAALAEAERGGHAFIALKWFRDSFLPRKAFRWNQHPESRQAVLAEAIQRGVVLTSKIANPKTPPIPPPPSASTAPKPAFPRRRSASIPSRSMATPSPRPLKRNGGTCELLLP
jgi:hypothetical protein